MVTPSHSRVGWGATRVHSGVGELRTTVGECSIRESRSNFTVLSKRSCCIVTRGPLLLSLRRPFLFSSKKVCEDPLTSDWRGRWRRMMSSSPSA